MFTPLDGMKVLDLYTRTLMHGWLFVAPLKPGVLEKRRQRAADRREQHKKVVAIKERQRSQSQPARPEAA